MAETDEKAWEEAVAHNPEARLEIDGLLYTARIDKVTDKALSQEINRRYFEKYDMHEVFGEDVPEWWFLPAAGALCGYLPNWIAMW